MLLVTLKKQGMLEFHLFISLVIKGQWVTRGKHQKTSSNIEEFLKDVMNFFGGCQGMLGRCQGMMVVLEECKRDIGQYQGDIEGCQVHIVDFFFKKTFEQHLEKSIIYWIILKQWGMMEALKKHQEDVKQHQKNTKGHYTSLKNKNKNQDNVGRCQKNIKLKQNKEISINKINEL